MEIKVLLFLIFTFCFSTVNAQNEFGRIILKNGNKLEGRIKIKSSGKVKLKKLGSSDRVVYDLNEIEGLWISDQYYEPLEIERLLGGTRTELLEVVIKGKTVLFKREVTSGRMAMGGMNGFYGSWIRLGLLFEKRW